MEATQKLHNPPTILDGYLLGQGAFFSFRLSLFIPKLFSRCWLQGDTYALRRLRNPGRVDRWRRTLPGESRGGVIGAFLRQLSSTKFRGVKVPR